ncbi:MAG: hypothetical protein H0X03_02780 [Nitrosopumilus sp.]|nr:hypothetical protein [Nitrosopumilus sp.]
MNKKRKETIILFIIIVIIPAVIYFTAQINNIVCAHTFSDDNSALLLGIIEEYKQELSLIKNNVDSNFTLSKLHVYNILDQSYVSRIANQFYPTESRTNGVLTKSFNNLNELFLSNTETGNNSKSSTDAIKTETNNINPLLDKCKKIFLVDQLTNNNSTFNALIIKSLLDSSLKFYESGINSDSSGNVISIGNNVYYQNALGLANRSDQLLHQMDESQFQNNATKMNLFKELQMNLDTFNNFIKNTENYNKIIVLIHMNIHPDLSKIIQFEINFIILF